mmetsp:Transcript_56169/g.149937  ORF Transcript_56169/g.149937 Transcript_56169/m.149937 type:complete len:200 (-) Transcript_56169:190-789(-)
MTAGSRGRTNFFARRQTGRREHKRGAIPCIMPGSMRTTRPHQVVSAFTSEAKPRLMCDRVAQERRSTTCESTMVHISSGTSGKECQRFSASMGSSISSSGICAGGNSTSRSKLARVAETARALLMSLTSRPRQDMHRHMASRPRTSRWVALVRSRRHPSCSEGMSSKMLLLLPPSKRKRSDSFSSSFNSWLGACRMKPR